MKLKIIFGCILAIGILLSIPSISAVQSNIYEEKTESQFNILNSKLDELKLRYNEDPAEPTFIILFLLSIILNLLRVIKFSSLFVIVLIIVILRQINNNNSTSVSY